MSAPRSTSPGPVAAAARVAAATALALGLLSAGSVALAEPGDDEPLLAVVPADLTVALVGPSSIQAGDTGTWSLMLTHEAGADAAPAPAVRVALVLPVGVDLVSVGAVDGWTCVMSELSCWLDAGLAPGSSAPALPVELAFGSSDGVVELAALAHQGEAPGAAMRIDRGATAVAVVPATPVPADLKVQLAGPAEAPAGGTGIWTITVTNVDPAVAAPAIRLAMQLPEDVEVRSVGGSASWACVLSPFSCQLPAGLAPGQTAESMTVELAFASTAAGSRLLYADTYQNEDAGAAMRLDRAAAALVVGPAAAAEQPQVPDPSGPDAAPAAPATTGGSSAATSATSPASPGAPAPRPAARTSATAGTASGTSGNQTGSLPAQEPAEPAESADLSAASSGQPESLPFVDEPTTDAERSASVRSSGSGDGVGSAAMVATGLFLLVAVTAAGILLLRRRSA
jgi:hypothetical protein